MILLDQLKPEPPEDPVCSQESRVIIQEAAQELEQMLASLTSAMLANQRNGWRTPLIWEDFPAQLDRIGSIDELRTLRRQMVNGLGLDRARAPARAQSGCDIATGLPGPALAMEMIRDEMQTGKTSFAVAFVVDRITVVRERFGREVADELVEMASELIF